MIPLAESNTLELALHLGRLYHSLDEPPKAMLRDSIEAKVRVVLPPGNDAFIRRKFAEAKKLPDGYRWVMRVYSLLDHGLRWWLD